MGARVAAKQRQERKRRQRSGGRVLSREAATPPATIAPWTPVPSSHDVGR